MDTTTPASIEMVVTSKFNQLQLLEKIRVSIDDLDMHCHLYCCSTLFASNMSAVIKFVVI